jgi:hypothetical protein
LSERLFDVAVPLEVITEYIDKEKNPEKAVRAQLDNVCRVLERSQGFKESLQVFFFFSGTMLTLKNFDSTLAQHLQKNPVQESHVSQKTL